MGRNALPVPVDGQIPVPLAFFNPPPAFPEQPPQAPRKLSPLILCSPLRIPLELALILEAFRSVWAVVDAVGLTAAAGLGWGQPREQEQE